MTSDEEAALEDIVWEMTKPHTQEAIAARLGVSQQRVDKIEKRAMAKLRGLVGEDWRPDKGSSGGRNITLVLK